MIIIGNGHQYSSKELKTFAKQWEFNYTTTSPLHPQVNELVEKSVKHKIDLLTKPRQL